jgi:membrane protein DedA with SNARE-associated domain
VLQSLLDLVPSNIGPWGYVLVFVAAASESALLLGLVIPGETILLLAGVLASRGQGNVVIYMVTAVVGAVVGDSIGYEFGRHFGERLRRSTFGRWVGDPRWALAGQARMPYRRFLVWNIAGAMPIGVLHVGLGYLAGESYHVVDRYLGIGHWALLGVALIAGAAYWTRRQRSQRSHG